MLCVAFAACNLIPEPDPDPDNGDGTGGNPEEKEPYTKVVILSGQSNMIGATYFDYVTPDAVGQERYDVLTSEFENIKIVKKPISSIDEFENMRAGMGDVVPNHLCFGPELGLAEKLAEIYPDEEIYVIKFAVSGSTMSRDWKSGENSTYNYVYLKQIVTSALSALEEAGKNPKIVGMCWMQGEADACDYLSQGYNTYEQNMTAFLEGVRKDFDEYSLNGALNFIDAYIASCPTVWKYDDLVNAAKLAVANKSAHNFVLDTLQYDLVFPGVKGLTNFLEDTVMVPDPMHYDSLSMLKLGQMFAEQVIEICENPIEDLPDGNVPDGDEGKTEAPYTKVVILSGQSNMYGSSLFKYVTPGVVGEPRYKKLTSDFKNIKIAQKPIASIDEFETLSLKVEPMLEDSALFGPELGMAEVFSEQYPDEEIYFIKFAVGGSTLAKDWITPSRSNDVSYIYIYFNEVVTSALKALENAGKNPKVVAMCWMQGESDAQDYWKEGWHYDYHKNLTTFIGDMRADLDKYALDGTLNFVDAYISDSFFWTYHPIVNLAKQRIANSSDHNFVINTLAPDLVFPGVRGLTYNLEGYGGGVDPMHYDSLSELKLGQMFAEQIIEICEKVN